MRPGEGGVKQCVTRMRRAQKGVEPREEQWVGLYSPLSWPVLRYAMI